jgi:purine-nucleoside phosphorylase
VLGTGSGSLVEHIDVAADFDFQEIPHFPGPTAPGHRGRWVCGSLARVPVIAMQGRLHGYERHPATLIALGIRTMHALGVEMLVLSNACGGMNPHYRVGEVVVIADQINLTWDNPLVGPLDLNPGVGYPDMSCPYDARLMALALRSARRRGLAAHQGVYVGVLGPHYETRAEYRMLRRIGADAVGMSTVHEVIAARQCGLRVLGLSVVTNLCLPDRLERTGGGQVMAAARAAEPATSAIMRDVIAAELGAPGADSPGDH